MRKVCAFLILSLLIPSLVFAKTEDGTSVAPPIVLYGSTGSAIVPLKVDSTGAVYTSASGTAAGWTSDGSTKTTTTYNVGIGTPSPAAKLQVGSGSSTLGATLTTDSALIKGNLEVDGKLYGDGSGLTGVSSGWTQGSGIVYLTTSSDKVGIGSTSPTSKVSIVGLGTTSATTALTIRDSSSAATFSFIDNGNLGMGTAAPLGKLDIRGTGNVGIGTTSPQTVLEVVGTVKANYFGVGTTSPAAKVAIKTSGGDPYLNATSSTPGDVFTITSTGNVGLGSASPVALLQVGSGTPTSGPTFAANSAVLKNDLQVDGVIYNPGITVISGNTVCFNTTTKQLYVKSTCP